MLDKNLSTTHICYVPIVGTLCYRLEDEPETQLRHRIFGAIKACVPKEFYRQLPEGDVRGLYINIVQFGGKESADQIIRLNKALIAVKKQGRSMTKWLTEILDIYDKLEILNQPEDLEVVVGPSDTTLSFGPRNLAEDGVQIQTAGGTDRREIGGGARLPKLTPPVVDRGKFVGAPKGMSRDQWVSMETST
mgnify:CR=1 FL=1